ncbi:MAG: hypothetical protein H7282_01950 [Cytophagaceae bacterium]|nr:hypothetical protein [Cytophagaceae bacterium]
MTFKLSFSFAISSLVAVAILFSSCKKTKEDYKVSKLIESKAEQDSLLLGIITIIEEHIPDTVKKADRFQPENKAFFESKLNKYDFECLTKNDKGEYLYFVRKPAYGVPELYVGLAGKFKLDANRKITDFEESYRLFRMPAHDLDRKGIEVYEAFINNQDLTQFHRDLDTDPYIEFPNEHVGYDKQKLDWYFIKPY